MINDKDGGVFIPHYIRDLNGLSKYVNQVMLLIKL